LSSLRLLCVFCGKNQLFLPPHPVTKAKGGNYPDLKPPAISVGGFGIKKYSAGGQG
jgi:hypothetical protein